jgi:ATP-dependent helicase YprA (DUF1998 family)
MKCLLLIVLTAITSSAFSQKEIKLEDVRNHIGDSVKLRAKIYDGKYIESAEGRPTFLNVGNKYPNALLTLVIWEDVRKQFKSPPEEMYNKGNEKWITGKIILYKNKPEIVITNPNQISEVVAVPLVK